MALYAVAHALDRLRSPSLRVLAGQPWVRAVLVSPSRRLEWLAVLAWLGAMGPALLAPAWMFVWGPLLLGVWHVLADIRYLCLPRYVPWRYSLRDALVVVPLAATLIWPSPVIGLGAALVAWWLAPRRHVVVAVIVLGLSVVAWHSPLYTSYVLLHLHNIVALVLFAMRGRGRARWGLPLAGMMNAIVILLGGCDAWPSMAPLEALAPWVLPDAALAAWSPTVWRRVVLSFVFLQGLHYGVWLRLIPEALRSRTGLRGYVASAQALVRDLGGPLLIVALVIAIGLGGYATVDKWAARDWYLHLFGFHAYLELAFLVRWAGRC